MFTKSFLSFFLILAVIMPSALRAGGFLLEGTAGSSDVARLIEEATPSDEGLIFIGDMAFDPETLRERGFAGKPWPAGVLPIGFHPNVSPKNQKRFFAACAEWSKVAAVRCIKRTSEADWIRVESGDGNWSMLGRVGGMQRLQMHNWQWKFIIAHEIGHALGLGHEQQRPDRDHFVEIIKDAIPAGSLGNFRILPMRTPSGYDFDSVMHYGQTAFGKPDPNTGLARTTIRPRPDFSEFARFMGQRRHLSKGDRMDMAAEYGPPFRVLPDPDALRDSEADAALATALERAQARSIPGLPDRPVDAPATISIEDHPGYLSNVRKMAEGGIEKVFGGTPVIPPRMSDVVGVAASFSDIVKCTGTLVASDRVVTARHCACSGISGRVLVGTNDATGRWHTVDRVRTPGDACAPLAVQSNPDIAVLHLADPIDDVTPRKLASQDEIDAAALYTVAGFGFTENLMSGIKHETTVPSATNDCAGSVAAWNASEANAFGCVAGVEIVAGRAGLGRDSCNGDSGGPLFLLPEGESGGEALRLAGVTSRATAGGSATNGLICGDGGIYVRLTPENVDFVFAD